MVCNFSQQKPHKANYLIMHFKICDKCQSEKNMYLYCCLIEEYCKCTRETF